MDLDFLILTVAYLGIILFIHYHLTSSKSGMIKSSLPGIITIPDEETNILPVAEEEARLKSEASEEIIDVDKIPKEYPNIDIGSTDNLELIINKKDLDDIGDKFNGDFMKYLDVEESNNNDHYRKLSESMDINLEKKSDLSKFFQENNKKYVFEEVPTLSEEYIKSGLLADTKTLNNDKKIGNVFAFDEFNSSFSAI